MVFTFFWRGAVLTFPSFFLLLPILLLEVGRLPSLLSLPRPSLPSFLQSLPLQLGPLLYPARGPGERWSPSRNKRNRPMKRISPLFHCCYSATKTRSSAIAEGPRDASCQLKSCQLPRNNAETTCTTNPEQIEVIKLEGYSGPMCNKHVHSTITRSSRFHCPISIINIPTTDELYISPVYRRLAVAKFSKSTMYKLLT